MYNVSYAWHKWQMNTSNMAAFYAVVMYKTHQGGQSHIIVNNH